MRKKTERFTENNCERKLKKDKYGRVNKKKCKCGQENEK